jgi:uncharacterized protein (DUF1330 family)
MAAKGYWIAHGDVTDPERYARYRDANAVAFARFGARFLVRGGASETPEGQTLSRHIVIEFPSYEAALACYRSPEYQAAMAHRQGAATIDLVIVEGYEGPQPA